MKRKYLFIGLCVVSFLPAAGFQNESQLEQFRQEASSYARQGNYDQAIAVAEQLLQATESQFGVDDLKTADAAGLLAQFNRYAHHYQDAERLCQRQIKILETHSETSGHQYLRATNNLAMLYRDTGRFTEAEPLFQRALSLGKVLSAGDPELAFAYNNLGLNDFSLKKYDQAEEMLKTALRIRQSSPGVDKELLAISHDNLGNLYLAMGRLSDAEAQLTTAYPLFREALGDADPDTLICLMNLAMLYSRTNQQQQGIESLSTALETVTKARGQYDPSLIKLLHHRGTIYLDGRHFSSAEADLQQAIAIADHNRHGNDPAMVQILLDLSHLYQETNEYEKGDDVLERAQKIEEGLSKPDSDVLSSIYHGRGWFQEQLQNWTISESFLRKVLEIDSHTDARARALNNLANVETREGKLEDAEGHAKEAISINERRETKDVDLGENHNLLGSILEREGKPVPAEDEYRRAVTLLTSLLGQEHPRVISAETNLGLLLMNLGKTDEAGMLAQRRAKAFEASMDDLLAFGTEQQAIKYVRSQNPFAFLGTLGQPGPVASAVINYKGAVTDAIYEKRAGAGEPVSMEKKQAIERWREARRKLTEWNLQAPSGGGTGAESASALKQWQDKRDRLEAELSRAEADISRLNGSAGPSNQRFNIRVEDIQSRIPAHTALIDYVRYSHYLGKVKWEDRYGAVILTPDGPPQWVMLGKAWDIEQTTQILSRAIVGSDPVNKLSNALRVMFDLVVNPVLDKLPQQTNRLLICPDGELNFVSFATLLTGHDQFLAERYSITYLANARSLLKTSDSAPSQSVVIYANPAFRIQSKAPAAPQQDALFTGFEIPALNPLPFTAAEAESVKQIAIQNGWKVSVYEGVQATEERVRATNKPGILHLATHGFYLPRAGTELVPGQDTGRGAGGVRPVASAGDAGAKPPSAKPMGDVEAYNQGRITSVELIEHGQIVLDDPMLRSGIAFAGAQDTLDNWRHGKVIPTNRDGVLNGEEAASLNLGGTWVVTLSSCESGLGEAEPGEGVFGLRRGFLQAGAQNVFTTLWPVSDATTAKLMAAFYRQAFASHDAPSALADVQRQFLVRIRRGEGLEPAVRLAGAFVLTTGRRPNL